MKCAMPHRKKPKEQNPAPSMAIVFVPICAANLLEKPTINKQPTPPILNTIPALEE